MMMEPRRDIRVEMLLAVGCDGGGGGGGSVPNVQLAVVEGRRTASVGPSNANAGGAAESGATGRRPGLRRAMALWAAKSSLAGAADMEMGLSPGLRRIKLGDGRVAVDRSMTMEP